MSLHSFNGYFYRQKKSGAQFYADAPDFLFILSRILFCQSFFEFFLEFVISRETNEFALNIDLREDPPMFDVPGSKSHQVASWLMHPNAPKVEMPETLRKRLELMKKKGGMADE